VHRLAASLVSEVMSRQRRSASIDPFEVQLQATLDKIPAYTWYATPDGALTFVNTRAADYFGLPSDHPLRLGIETGAAWDSHVAMLHPDDHEETRRIWSTCLKTCRAGEMTFRARKADGTYRWFLSRAEPHRAEDGALRYWIGVNLDVQERKRAEFYLAEAQRLGHTGSWAFDADGFKHWSSELFAIHGLESRGDAPSIPEYLALVHPDDRQSVARAIQKMLAEGSGFDFTKRIVRPDGSLRHVRCVGVATAEGNAFVGTGMDVTEQEQLTEALRKSELELQQMLDFMPLCIAVIGADRCPLYANRASLDYLGMSLDEWRRRGPIGDETHPDDRERLLAEADRATASASAFELEVRVRRGDGTFRWFFSRFNPLRDEKGQVKRWFIASTDIEDRKRAEDRLQQENVALREDIAHASGFEEIIGTSATLRSVLDHVAKVARSQSTVLITGETGTGKELVARAIHCQSPRGDSPFVAVSCAAVPRELIASELFGHEQGAFTGATQRRLGRFELAHGGTLFLDEIGELPLEIQVALLRVLQEREFERVGGRATVRVDVRVIAATNRDLQAAIAAGTFRSDLFYRLNVVPIAVPPLRERTEDIPLLVEYFIDRYARQAGKTIRRVGKRAIDRLRAYPWPGNVRELQNVIERSVILCDGNEEFTVDEKWLSVAPAVASRLALPGAVAAHEKAMIEEALRVTGGRVFGPSGAAVRLCIPRSTLESRIRALGIDKQRFRT
jgi:formate hydrogenlyase transcriptional activator